MKRLYLSLISILFLTTQVFSQKIEVSGFVTDAETNETLPGVTVVLKSMPSQGTTSDSNGAYLIGVPNPSDTLIFSFIGYESQEVPINARTNIDVPLSTKSTDLDEVIVVGYSRQKKKVITGSVASIDDESINATPILRVEQALQGRMAGVQVTSQSGQPGDEPTVRIRGIGTTGNAKPLYLVDGVAVGGIDYLNPSDIESVEVLKDAASAAIYGARGANGVVLITTKTGTAGKIRVEYNGYYGLQNVARKLDMLNADEYKMMMNEGARNAGLSEPFDLLEIPANDTDWQEALFEKNAPIQNHHVSVSGGSAKSTFASSFSYFTQEGILGGPKSQFDRLTARLNSKQNVNRFFSFGSNLSFTHLIKRGIDANQSFRGVYGSALNLDPLTAVIETDETKLAEYPYSAEPVVQNEAGEYYGISEYIGAEIVNPLGLLAIDNDKTRKDEFVGNVYAQVSPIEGLAFKTSVGANMAYLLNDGFKPLFFLNGAQLNDQKTSVNKRIERFFTWQWENTVSYDRDIKDHTIGFLAGTTATEYNYEDLSGFNAGVPVSDPDNVYLDLATDTVWTSNGGANHSALFSLFGRVTYDYKDKYSLTAILRRDGSSKFGANNRFGLFPSIGVAWLVSDEPFMSSLNFLDYLKLRASWGINGNQEIGDFQFLSTLDETRRYDWGSGSQVGASPEYVENADIRWEESRQLDIGLEMGFFRDRLQATIDYYIKDTEGLLERIAIPGHIGNTGPIANVGSVRNKGIEWSVNWKSSTPRLGYSIGVNGSFNKNKMTFISNTEKVIPGASWAIAGAVTRSEEGEPIAYFWGYQTDGIFQNQSEVFQHINRAGELLQPNAVPGDVRFVDINEDGIIDGEDRTKIGNPTPELTYGITASIDFKNFDLSTFLQGVHGNEIFNGTQRQDLRFTNRTTKILDRWTAEGSTNELPRYTWGDINNNYRVSDLYIESGSFLRMKNIQLGYTLPSNLLQRLHAERIRFYISAENLFTLTKYTGVDPEIGAITDSPFDIGIDRGVYPYARTFRFGTNITF